MQLDANIVVTPWELFGAGYFVALGAFTARGVLDLLDALANLGAACWRLHKAKQSLRKAQKAAANG